MPAAGKWAAVLKAKMINSSYIQKKIVTLRPL